MNANGIDFESGSDCVSLSENEICCVNATQSGQNGMTCYEIENANGYGYDSDYGTGCAIEIDCRYANGYETARNWIDVACHVIYAATIGMKSFWSFYANFDVGCGRCVGIGVYFGNRSGCGTARMNAISATFSGGNFETDYVSASCRGDDFLRCIHRGDLDGKSQDINS